MYWGRGRGEECTGEEVGEKSVLGDNGCLHSFLKYLCDNDQHLNWCGEGGGWTLRH